MHTAVQLTFSLEIASMQLTPTFKMSGLQLKPTSRVVSMHLRAAFWVLAGVLVTIWGMTGLQAHDSEFSPQDPVIGVIARSSGSFRA